LGDFGDLSAGVLGPGPGQGRRLDGETQAVDEVSDAHQARTFHGLLGHTIPRTLTVHYLNHRALFGKSPPASVDWPGRHATGGDRRFFGRSGQAAARPAGSIASRTRSMNWGNSASRNSGAAQYGFMNTQRTSDSRSASHAPPWPAAWRAMTAA